MLDLARILAAVSAVSEPETATETPETQAGRGVSGVSAVSAEIGKNAEATTPNRGQPTNGEGLARTSIYDRDNRDNRDTSNGAGFPVSAGALAPETTETPPSRYGTGRTTWGAPLPPPLPMVRCAECEHFRRNKSNPLAGVGRCRLGHPDGPGNLPQYPDAPRLCGSFRDDSG